MRIRNNFYNTNLSLKILDFIIKNMAEDLSCHTQFQIVFLSEQTQSFSFPLLPGLITTGTYPGDPACPEVFLFPLALPFSGSAQIQPNR